MIRIAVVEDHEIVRDAIATLLGDTSDIGRAVGTGTTYVAPEIIAKLAAQQLDPQPRVEDSPGALEALSYREHEVFRQVVWGYTTKDIARRLSISVKTVETHRTNMNRKLRVRTTADVIRLAVAHGITVAPHVSPEQVRSN